MAYRFTNTEKWTDSWFSNLDPVQMLLFIYLCDNCDIAGFIEVNYKRWANDLNTPVGKIEGACKGLARGLTYSKSLDCIFIRNFLKHQKNLPLNPENKAHVGILKRFDLYRDKFDIQNINEFLQRGFEGASMGLPSPSGNGIGNDTGKVIDTWKSDFEIYKEELKKAYLQIVTPEYIAERKKYHPNLDIPKSLGKSIHDYWNTEAGWKNKKAKKTVEIDWLRTFNNALDQKMNQVYEKRN